MSYSVVLSASFKHSVKRLEKRFTHVKEDMRLAAQVLLQNPRLGVLVPGGDGIRKFRVRNSDLAKGKSAGYRLLYFVTEQPEPVLYLLLIYHKSDQENVTQRELRQLLKELDRPGEN